MIKTDIVHDPLWLATYAKMRDMERQQHHIYGFHIDSSESDPAAAVTYLEDAVGATPACMDYENEKFLWGELA